MANSPHHMVCLMEDLQSHLRAGCHNRIGTVGAVADDNIFTLILLKLHIVLNLSRTIPWPQTLERCARLILDCLLTSAYGYYFAVHLIRNLTHTFFTSTARTDKKPYVRSVKIRELNRNKNAACRLRNRRVKFR